MELIGQEIGTYQIVERVGEGGMAAVYRAHQPSLNRDVAIKVLSGKHADEDVFRQRFEREAKAVAQLTHPHIVPIHDFGEDRVHGVQYIVTDYIKGGSLHDALKRGLPMANALAIIAQVADALDYAHAHGVVHRDIKPGNILLTEDGRALLTDFGIAKIAEATQYTETGAVIGTPAYMSPEQITGAAVDGRSDVYSLGIVCYELLAGQPPFRADTPLAVLHQQVYDPPPPLRQLNPRVPGELERVVARALAKDRAQRYRTAGEFAAALRKVKLGAPGLAAPARVDRAAADGVFTPSRLGALARKGTVRATRFSLGLLMTVSKWMLQLMAALAIVSVILGTIVIVALSYVVADVAEKAIANYPLNWKAVAVDVDRSIVVDDQWLQSLIGAELKTYAFETLQDPVVHIRSANAVVVSAKLLNTLVALDARLYLESGAPQLRLERVNGVTPYVVGGILSDGVNRGLRQFYARAPVALVQLETSDGQATMRFARVPGAEPTPAPTRSPAEQVADLLTRVDAAWDRDWPEAIRLLEQANTIDQSNTLIVEKLYAAHYNFGQNLVVQGRPGDAIQQYQAALAVKPGGVEAAQALAGLSPTPVATSR
ncbi:MAG: protein kinase [Chloroflexi bacterium]|nr:protein kinase [Chloroflexota bacterium]